MENRDFVTSIMAITAIKCHGVLKDMNDYMKSEKFPVFSSRD